MIYPNRHPTPRPALNAIAHRYQLETDPAHETAEERRVRYLRITQMLIERGVDLAHEAADQAAYVMQSCPPGPSIPGSSAAAIARAEARARERHPNYGTVFAQLSRSIRQTIALQAHIAEGAPLHRPAQHAAASPRHAPAATHPERPRIPRLDAAERPDWAVRTGPGDQIPIEDLLETIRADLALASNPGPGPRPQNAAPALTMPAGPRLTANAPHRPRTWRPPAEPRPSG